MVARITKLWIRLRSVVDADRGWSLSAAFCARIGGFVTSFLLSRFGGAAAVGAYSSVVNTASTVIAPVLPALSNSATLEAHDTRGRGFPAVFVAHGVLAAALSLICGAVFVVVGQFELDMTNAGTWLSMIAGVAVVCSQLLSIALQGVFYGAGEFRRAAVCLMIVFAMSLSSSIPAVSSFGIRGAFGVLVGTSVVLPVMLIVFGLTLEAVPARAEVAGALRRAARQLLRSMPSMGATAVTSLATWLTTIVLVQRSYGAAGVGVVAIGAQWLTLLVLAVTSWGGVTLRMLSGAHRQGGAAFRKQLKEQVSKNVRFTLLGAVLVTATADLIVRLYGASDPALSLILRLNALTSLLLAVNNVGERAFFCANRQREWLWISVGGGTVTVLMAAVLLPRSVLFGPIAALVGTGVVALVSFARLTSWRSA